jgi:plastocyanin
MKHAMFPLIVLLGLAALFLTGQTSREVRAADDKPARVAVTIDNFNFAPSPITVAVGTTVIWTNRDDVPHNVTSTDKVFASPTLDTDEKFEFTFQKAGTFNYYCTIHPKMAGKVVVQ